MSVIKILQHTVNLGKTKRLVLSIKKHWLTALVAGVLAFSAGVQTTSWMIGKISGYWYQSVGWMDYEQEKLDQIGPGVQVGYIKNILGEPLFRDGGEKYDEYVFKRQFGYVQVVADQNDKALLYSVVVCKTDFKPTIKLASGDVQMQRDTLLTKGSGATHYFISGATANSYLIEGGYGGNPTNYQEIYVGATDACGGLDAPVGAYDVLKKYSCSKDGDSGKSFEPDCEYDIDNLEIRELRSSTRINTIVITAPTVKMSDLQPRRQYGPSRVELRVLPGYYSEWKR